LLSDGLQQALGGNAIITADLGYDSNGVATIDRLNVAAPQFRMVGGRGRYDADGRISFAANATSDQYGPIGVTASGTVASPVLHLAAARPGVGVGLADLVADVRGNNDTYLVTAKAQSDYGPIDANMAVAVGKGLTVELRQGTAFSGIGLTGRIQQLAQGPFGGTVQAHGSGVSGHVDLSAQGKVQRAVVALAAQNSSLPGKVGLTVERALINADVVMTDQPQVNGDVQLAGTRMGDLYVAVARANLAYRDGHGQAKVLVEGAANIPSIWRRMRCWRRICGVSRSMAVNGVDVASRNPLQIVPERDLYAASRDPFGQHRHLAGRGPLRRRHGAPQPIERRRSGAGQCLCARSGAGGKASGSLDFTQARAVPSPRPTCVCRSPALPAPAWPLSPNRWTSPWPGNWRPAAAMRRHCCAGAGQRWVRSSSVSRPMGPRRELVDAADGGSAQWRCAL
jgi:translocation and assembly module TamB